jgi:hypothetical protein
VNKIRNLISILFGVLALVVLALGLAWLLGSRGALPAQQISPVQTPTPGLTETPTSTRYVEPTAPSEDWPTLTSPPTRGIPTPRGTPMDKGTPIPTQTPTPFPSLPLPPIPEGEPPLDLWSILYLPLEDELAVHGVLVDAQGRRWSDPQVVYDFGRIDPEPHTRLANLAVAPTGDWLAVAVAYLESSKVWLLDLASRELHPVSECEEHQSCVIRDWSSDGRIAILQLSRHYQSPVDRPDDFITVDVAGDVATGLPLPDTTFDRFSVREVILSPDGRSIAWVIRNRDEEEMTEIWLTDSQGGQVRLLASEAGRIWNLAWHPNNSQVAYSLAVGEQRPSVWLLSVKGQESMQLVPSSDSFSNPVWSPEGLQVAMIQCADVPAESSLADQKCNISVLDRRNGLVNPIIVSPGRAYWNVSWSPNGELLAFISANDKDLQAVWLHSSETSSNFPISGYLRPFSEYVWLPYSFVGEW